MSLLAGTRLRDYQIQSLIGKGGMGEVYLAEELTLGRKVAIKVLKQEAIADPLFLERFRNEARVLGQLNHPNIVGLYSFFEDSGSYYLVMQYAPGITLSELIRRIGPIPEQRAMRIFAQIGEALAYAHSENVVHRDIKPSNIMIDSEKNDRALVMDFGIARLMTAQHITRTGTQMGTPCYMSPEQVLGEKEITNRSDIYSAGVVLYEMLSGSIPYDLETESLYKVQNRIVQEALPDPRKCYEYISEANVRLVMSLTQKDAHNRPDSIQQAITGSNAPLQAPQVVPKPSSLLAGDHSPIMQKPVVVKPIPQYTQPAGQADMPQRHKASKGDMIYVANDRFRMGSPLFANSKPLHMVGIGPYMISPTLVTQRQWREVMGNAPSHFHGDDLPVESITWHDALEYCNRRSTKEGLQPCYSGSPAYMMCDWNANGYRLPTEAEWEFAARGGSLGKGYDYSGSAILNRVAWCNCMNTNIIARKDPNELGIHDMSGNVFEWVWDWYGEYSPYDSTNPIGPDSGEFKVMRGGAWNIIEQNCHVAYRACSDPQRGGSNIGLRVAMSV